jgi:2-hydroxyglutarate dehydrogenase
MVLTSSMFYIVYVASGDVVQETLATAQTGHNSGVIHAGMYYKPGSMKAKLCVQGAKLTYEYCQEKGIPFEKVGKLIVAVHDDEIENLKVIYERALENKVVDVEWLDNPKAIRKVEPYCTGLQAVHCRSTGKQGRTSISLLSCV